MQSKLRGFTICELMIVVTIIALLAAIAVPNYREAHVASDVAQAKSDLHTLVQALEAYRLNNVDYPRMNSLNCCTLPPGFPGDSSSSETLERLTTPISYLDMPCPFIDPFEAENLWVNPALGAVRGPNSSIEETAWKQYFYTVRNSAESAYWNDQTSTQTWYLLESAGPDKTHNSIGYLLNSQAFPTNFAKAQVAQFIYDPTNGTMSRGSIWNYGGNPIGFGTALPIMIDTANSSAVSNWGDWE